MALLSPYLLVRVEVALGVRNLEPLSEGQVLSVLRWWFELREGGARDTELGMPRAGETEEHGWLLLVATIAAKLGRLPRNPLAELPWQCSAVEARLYVERAIDDEQQRLGLCERCGVPGRVRRYVDIDRARGTLRRLCESRAYRDGIERLRWELAAALADDGAFREAVRRRVWGRV